ncbi:MAG: hypothetical protein LUI05_04090, partial [Oscillospiraceae bacterium]|nr:hypothetical protein [Oscillospiraceae bacterium]
IIPFSLLFFNGLCGIALIEASTTENDDWHTSIRNDSYRYNSSGQLSEISYYRKNSYQYNSYSDKEYETFETLKYTYDDEGRMIKAEKDTGEYVEITYDYISLTADEVEQIEKTYGIDLSGDFYYPCIDF